MWKKLPRGAREGAVHRTTKLVRWGESRRRPDRSVSFDGAPEQSRLRVRLACRWGGRCPDPPRREPNPRSSFELRKAQISG